MPRRGWNGRCRAKRHNARPSIADRPTKAAAFLKLFLKHAGRIEKRLRNRKWLERKAFRGRFWVGVDPANGRDISTMALCSFGVPPKLLAHATGRTATEIAQMAGGAEQALKAMRHGVFKYP